MGVLKHGLCAHPVYRLLAAIKERCYRKGHLYYFNYGGRGITVCDLWLNDFISFYNWCLNNGWQPGLEIDRIDNNGNYEPDNCRFVSRKENSRNKRNNVLITIDSVTHPIIVWSELSGIDHTVIRARVTRGWPSERILMPKIIRNKI